jgi:hypothetical protein
MTLLVEDGQGLEFANSYASLAACDAYHAGMGTAAWVVDAEDAANIAAREQALIRGTAAIDRMYGGRFRGRRLREGQALNWPRENACDDDGYSLSGVPMCVVSATCEAALRAFQGTDLMPDMERGGAVIQETIGPISTTYAAGAPAGTTFPAIDAILRRCLTLRGVSIVRG